MNVCTSKSPAHAARSRADCTTGWRAGGRRRNNVAKASQSVCPRTVRKWVEPASPRKDSAWIAGSLLPAADRLSRLRRPPSRRWSMRSSGYAAGAGPALPDAAEDRRLTQLPSAAFCRSAGPNKLTALEPLEPIQRYEREKPGELIHLDIKKLIRLASAPVSDTASPDDIPRAVNRHPRHRLGFVHVCILDATPRASRSRWQVLADQRKESAVAFPAGRRRLLRHARRPHRTRDDRQRHRATDQRPSGPLCNLFLGLRQVFTKPYTPRQSTEGAELLYPNSAARMGLRLTPITTPISDQPKCSTGLHRYNWHRPHGSLKANTPISRLGLAENNLLRLHN